MEQSTRALDRIGPTRRPASTPVMYQRWRDLLFVHWSFDPEVVASTLPQDVEVDTFEGRAYVGLVPFTMRGVRPRGLPAVPWLSDFHETNIRTYAYVDGRPGVWFYSLDAANPVAVQIARTLFKLPYYHARMDLRRTTSFEGSESGDLDGEQIQYRTRRLGPGPRGSGADLAYRTEPGTRRATPGTLEHFLVERYLLFTAGARGRVYSGQVHHEPYPIQDATLQRLDEDLMAAVGFEVPPEPPLVHYAAGVDVEIFALEAIKP